MQFWKPKNSDTPDGIRIDFIGHRDLADVVTIGRECFEQPWEDADLRAFLGNWKASCFCQAAWNYAGSMVGYMAFEITANEVAIWNMAVTDAYRHQGIGRALVMPQAKRLLDPKRNQMITMVRETSMDAVLFFRSLGFRATGVIKSPFEGIDDDGYRFIYRYAATEEELIREGVIKEVCSE